MSMTAMGIIFMLVGMFTCAGAVGNWEWFMTSRRAWLLVKILGRNGARVFYVVLGLAIIAIGLYVMIAGPTS